MGLVNWQKAGILSGLLRLFYNFIPLSFLFLSEFQSFIIAFEIEINFHETPWLKKTKTIFFVSLIQTSVKQINSDESSNC
jgi:hypothetical protein